MNIQVIYNNDYKNPKHFYKTWGGGGVNDVIRFEWQEIGFYYKSLYECIKQNYFGFEIFYFAESKIYHLTE